MIRNFIDYVKLNMLCAKSVGMKDGDDLHRDTNFSRL